jgi:hypothetical protein
MPSTTPVTYPFDPTGTLASNLITGEQQILKLPTFENFHFLVPNLAPYFASTLQVSIKLLDGTVQPLNEGIDYYCTNLFKAASMACEKPIYGSVSFLDLSLSGIVTFNYQTIGGNWTLNQQQIAQIISNVLQNPRVTYWDQVTEYPALFPPLAHAFDLVDLTGAAELYTALMAIEAAIASKTYDVTLLNQAINTANSANVIANEAIVRADAAYAASNALDPTAAAATLVALQTAIATAEGTLPVTLTATVNNALSVANAAMLAVTALETNGTSSNGISDDVLLFMGQN